MKVSRNLVLVGLLLFIQLVHSHPGFMDSDEFMNSDDDESHDNHDESHDNHDEHHAHPHHVHSPFEAKGAKPTDETDSNTKTNNNNAQPSAPQKAVPNPLGTNVSGFNETCSGTKICNSDKALECASTNTTCQCRSGYVYIPATEGCLEISRPEGKGSTLSSGQCDYDLQCQTGKWGVSSRCEFGSRRCQCLPSATYHDETCYAKRTIGDTCTSHKECTASIIGSSSCNLLQGSSNRTFVCQCSEGWIWDNLIKECLKIPSPDTALNSVCKSYLQCKNSSLGFYGRCNRDTEKCDCHDDLKPGADNVVHYKYTCFQKKSINDTCNEQIECEASLENAICEEHDAYMTEKVCKCPPGRTCGPRKNGAMGTFASEMSFSTVACVAAASVALGRMSTGPTSVI